MSSTRTGAPSPPEAASSSTAGDARWRRLPTAIAARIFNCFGEFEDCARVAQCCRTLRRLAYHPDAGEPAQLALLVGRDVPHQFALRWVPHRLILRARHELCGDRVGVARLNHAFAILNRALASTRTRRRAFASIAFERFATDLVRTVDPTQLPPAADELVWHKTVDGSDGSDAHLKSATLREWWHYVLANQLQRVSFPFVDVDSDLLPPLSSSFRLTALDIGDFYSCSDASELFANLTNLVVREIESPASFVDMCDAIALRRITVHEITYASFRALCRSRGLARSRCDFSLTLDRSFVPPYYVDDYATQRRFTPTDVRRRHYNAHLFAPLASLSGLERLELRVPVGAAPLAIGDYRELARLTGLRFLRLDAKVPNESLQLPRLPHLVEFHAPHGGFAFSHLSDDSTRHVDECRPEASASPSPVAAAAAASAAESQPLKFPSLQRLSCWGSDRRLCDLPPHPALQTLHLCESRLDASDSRHFAATAAHDFPRLVEVRDSNGKYYNPTRT